MKKIILIRGPICAGKTTTVSLLKERLDDVSIIDMDAFKRAIDHTHASEWRDRLAFRSALSLADDLMKMDRTIVADIHSNKGYQYEGYRELANKNDYKLFSFLLYPPLRVCQKRNSERKIPGVRYKISNREIGDYWINPCKIEGEEVIDSSVFNPRQVLETILFDLNRLILEYPL